MKKIFTFKKFALFTLAAVLALSSCKQEPQIEANSWLSDEVPSLYETFKNDFDYFGIACEYGIGSYSPKELQKADTQKGLKKHCNTITMGNEFKPQFICQWWGGKPETNGSFTASNGKTISTPVLKGLDNVDAILSICKRQGLKMRGHVLVWHSQTDEAFFRIDYDPSKGLVDKETMTARQEWYIKTVIEHIQNWEKSNNYKVIWAWDVVNEAMADDAGKTYTGTSQNWLRGSTQNSENGSRWFQIYENEEFIVNAFRFANAYVNSDVKLCYNDYNEYMDYSGGWKTSAIEHIVTLIKNGEEKIVNGKSVKPRIDVIGMQSHVGISWPGVSSYENALKRFLALCDVHVTELDFSAETQSDSASAYKSYFNMLLKYGNTYKGSHKITNVTLWGINNKASWIYKGNVKYPLLFDENMTTDSFWAVINTKN